MFCSTFLLATTRFLFFLRLICLRGKKVPRPSHVRTHTVTTKRPASTLQPRWIPIAMLRCRQDSKSGNNPVKTPLTGGEWHLAVQELLPTPWRTVSCHGSGAKTRRPRRTSSRTFSIQTHPPSSKSFSSHMMTTPTLYTGGISVSSGRMSC